MMSHHVTCHVTEMSHASSLFKRKSKNKTKQNRINIKLEKLSKRKEELSMFKVFHNISKQENLVVKTVYKL